MMSFHFFISPLTSPGSFCCCSDWLHPVGFCCLRGSSVHHLHCICECHPVHTYTDTHKVTYLWVSDLQPVHKHTHTHTATVRCCRFFKTFNEVNKFVFPNKLRRVDCPAPMLTEFSCIKRIPKYIFFNVFENIITSTN